MPSAFSFSILEHRLIQPSSSSKFLVLVIPHRPSPNFQPQLASLPSLCATPYLLATASSSPLTAPGLAVMASWECFSNGPRYLLDLLCLANCPVPSLWHGPPCQSSPSSPMQELNHRRFLLSNYFSVLAQSLSVEASLIVTWSKILKSKR